MPIQLEFLYEGLRVIYRCKGVLALQHFSVANDRLLASPDRMRKLKYVLVDAASMEAQFFSPSEMDGIVLQDCQIASYGVNWARLSMPEMDSWCRHGPGLSEP
jgi:hypothetical protein